MLIDTHCHLHDREFFTAEQAEDSLKKAKEWGVARMICIGTDPEDSSKARDFAVSHEGVYWTYGVHPEHANNKMQLEYNFPRDGVAPARRYGRSAPHTSAVASGSPRKVYSKLPIAIGEVGLDYHYEGYNREAQIKLFEQMLQLAIDNNLPVSFHVREAFDDFFPVVGNFPGVRGVVHSFTDNKKVLKRIISETEFFIGVNGLATYSTLPMPPLERVVLETDAPFLAPVPYRGEQNEPAYVLKVAEWMAGKLGAELEEVACVTTSNAEVMFDFSRDS